MSNSMSLNGEEWAVVLDNKRVITETEMCNSPGNLSPWGKLMELCDTDGRCVVVLSARVLDRWYLAPTVSGSFEPHIYSTSKPTKFLCMRTVSVDGLDPGNKDGARGWIGLWAEFDTGVKVTLWVDVYNGNSFVQVT